MRAGAESRRSGASRLVRATLTLARSDLHAIEQTLVVQRGDELREYKFVETRFDLLRTEEVTPSVFEIDPEDFAAAARTATSGAISSEADQRSWQRPAVLPTLRKPRERRLVHRACWHEREMAGDRPQSLSCGRSPLQSGAASWPFRKRSRRRSRRRGCLQRCREVERSHRQKARRSWLQPYLATREGSQPSQAGT